MNLGDILHIPTLNTNATLFLLAIYHHIQKKRCHLKHWRQYGLVGKTIIFLIIYVRACVIIEHKMYHYDIILFLDEVFAFIFIQAITRKVIHFKKYIFVKKQILY